MSRATRSSAGDLLLDGVAVGLRLEQRPHARFHLEHLEWLGQIVIRSRLEAACLVLHLLERREKHDRHVGGFWHLAQPAAHLIAVQAGHDDVEQHEIGWGARRNLQRGCSVHRDTELVIGLQALDEDVEIGFGVVHDQHATVGERLHAQEISAAAAGSCGYRRCAR